MCCLYSSLGSGQWRVLRTEALVTMSHCREGVEAWEHYYGRVESGAWEHGLLVSLVRKPAAPEILRRFMSCGLVFHTLILVKQNESEYTKYAKNLPKASKHKRQWLPI